MTRRLVHLTATAATLIVVIGLVTTGVMAQEAAPEAEYGCCCPWSIQAGLCPASLTDFLLALPDVCMVLDEDGEVAGFCVDDPDGFYPFRGMSYPEAAEFVGQPSVGAMIDMFCGYDHSHWDD